MYQRCKSMAGGVGFFGHAAWPPSRISVQEPAWGICQCLLVFVSSARENILAFLLNQTQREKLYVTLVCLDYPVLLLCSGQWHLSPPATFLGHSCVSVASRCLPRWWCNLCPLSFDGLTDTQTLYTVRQLEQIWQNQTIFCERAD